MALPNKSNPTLDGVWIEPIELTPTNVVSEANTIPPECQSVVLGANVAGVTDFTVLPPLSKVPDGHIITLIAGTAASEVRSQVAGDKINNVDCGTDTAATGVLTSDNSQPTANDTVTIGATVYRFKAVADLAQLNDVTISTVDADTTLANLIKAINRTGTEGVHYFAGQLPNASVTAGTTITAHAFTVTAKIKGDIGNSIAKAEASTHLDWDGTGATMGEGALAGANASEYLLTVSSVVKFTKVNNTVGWMGLGWTKLGAIITAVTPD